MPFVMMPVHAQDYTSIYMVSGDNMEQIMDIAAKFESQSLFMDADKANDLMNDSFVRQMENLSYPQMQQVQLILAEKGIASRIREAGSFLYSGTFSLCQKKILVLRKKKKSSMKRSGL